MSRIWREENCSPSKTETFPDNHQNIIDINDKCLLHILGQLSPEDLNSVASTYRRLKLIARRIFQETLSHREFTIVKQYISGYDMDFIKSFLANFGDLIQKIRFVQTCGDIPWTLESEHEAKHNQLIYEVIRKYCSWTLKDFHLDCRLILDLSASDDAIGEPHFPNLISLTIIHTYEGWPDDFCYSVVNFLELLPSPATLENLSIEATLNDTLFEHVGRFRNLRRLTLIDCGRNDNYHHLAPLNQLNELYWRSSSFYYGEDGGDINISAMLTHLGSSQTLERLLINGTVVTNEDFNSRMRRFTLCPDLHFQFVWGP